MKTEKGQETPARTQLGATTVLAVVTIGFGGKAKPQVYISMYIYIYNIYVLVFYPIFVHLFRSIKKKFSRNLRVFLRKNSEFELKPKISCKCGMYAK